MKKALVVIMVITQKLLGNEDNISNGQECYIIPMRNQDTISGSYDG
jgi:hypothetical protein